MHPTQGRSEMSSWQGAVGRFPASGAAALTLLYAHPRFLDHDTGAHPESPERLRHITQTLDSLGLAQRCVRPTWEPAAEGRLLAVHDADYVERVAALARRRGGNLDPDTVVSPE